MKLFTIGFAETTAEEFFGLLRGAGVKRVVDVRLNNTSQLAGFSKKEDLRFFLREVGGIEYVHVPELAPTQGMLDGVRGKAKGEGRKARGGEEERWRVFEKEFKALMAKRAIEKVVSKKMVDGGCLLCSEKKPHRCHRRLVAEYLEGVWGGVGVRHLG